MRLLLLLSLLPIAVAWAARWWFATRVLENAPPRCRCNLDVWQPRTKKPGTLTKAEAPAADFGATLRDDALAVWMHDDPKAAKAREGTRRFGMAGPPLAAVIAVLAIIAAKIPALSAISMVLAVTAIAVLLGLMTLPGELAAITRHAREVFAKRAFPDSGDETHVLMCAQAHAWEFALPPVLRLMKHGKTGRDAGQGSGA